MSSDKPTGMSIGEFSTVFTARLINAPNLAWASQNREQMRRTVMAEPLKAVSTMMALLHEQPADTDVVLLWKALKQNARLEASLQEANERLAKVATIIGSRYEPTKL